MRRPTITDPGVALTIATAVAAMSATAATPDQDQCGHCHPNAVAEYRMSGMGRSISTPANDHPVGMYGHGLSGTMFRTTATTDGLVQEIERGGLRARYPIEYVIGSGNAAFGFLVRVGDALFQSPITYYTEQSRWGMAPGMEQETNPDFNRPVTSECLSCHAGRPAPIPDTVNRYGDPPFDPAAISCDRCHGSADQHLAQPSTATIFNPATAPPRERDSVCEQCHLGGRIRVLHPDRTFGSFQPGQRLEDVWTVFVGVPRTDDEQERFQVVSHVEQLALSRCSEVSGNQFWCGTCHNPHESPSEPKSYFSQRCQQCHDGSLPPDHRTRRDDCISCHMPRRQSHDSGHSAFTDHRISRHLLPPADPAPPDELRPWMAAPLNLRQRNQGVANILYGQRRGSSEMLIRGLEQLKAVVGSLRSDSAGLDALGTALVLSGSPRRGLRRLQQAVNVGPAGALQYNALATAWWAVGDATQAEATLEASLQLEPTLESSYRMLAQMYRDREQPSQVKAIWRRLLKERPRLIQVRQAADEAATP